MPVESRPPAQLRFGTFEVDLCASELRKQGARIKVQEQPFLVLKALLGRPGEIVTREELRSQIWTADTFVDFDNSLNTSINKLREALGDSAENPRFIETLPRRGYRFIAPVNGIDTPRRRWKIPVLLVAFVATLLAVGLYWRLQRGQRLTVKDTIVLADLTNTTGDSVFDETLKQGLRVQLEQSPFLDILSDERVGQELKLMGRQKDERLTQDLAREVCLREASKAILVGSISNLGTRYVIGLNALDCNTGDVLVSEQVEADSRENVIKALGASTTRLRKKLGESLTSVQEYDVPLEKATTRSLEALKAYSLGVKTLNVKGAPSSAPFFRRAVELDPLFAMAYGRLAIAYDMSGEVDLKTENMRKAFSLRDRVSARERLYLETHYYHSLTGELEKAEQLYEVWRQIYPRDPTPHDNLQNIYAYQGKHEEALTEGREALRLRPYAVSSYEDVVSSSLCLNRLDDAQAILQQADQRRLQSELLLWLRYQLALLKNDVGERERLVAQRAGQSWPCFEGEEGVRQAQLGRLREARGLWQRAINTIQNHGPAELATYYRDTAALTQAYVGNPQEARADVAAGQKLTVNRLSEPWAAFALAVAGDVKGADRLTAELNRRWPLDSVVQHYWRPTIDAAIALNNHNAQRAIESLAAMGTYEMSIEGNLDPSYLRGQAYLMLGNGSAAAPEFRKILDHPGLVGCRPIGALAHLGLARAYALQGYTAKARAAYHDFMTLWKDADPDIPILKEAKAEYAKLK
jgi:DNA-binding winged helix-turn-helix (wHTH) protein/tetratricopeptide (TPR) repeat protein